MSPDDNGAAFQTEDDICFSADDVKWIASIAFVAGVVFTGALVAGLATGGLL